MTNNRILIGERIEYAIKLRGKTNVDVANAIGKDKSTIGRYIKGEVEKINTVILQAIANYLDVNPVWLMGKDVQMEIDTKNNLSIPNNTTLLYNGDDELKIEIANLTKQILENTDNTDTLVMLRNMLSGVCRK